MSTLEIENHARNAMERDVVKALQDGEYTLNTVNCYGENLLHVSVSTRCLEITKEILRKADACRTIDRKNKFGWTPLMLAIRNRDINIVKLLLEKNANTNESTYHGMSVLGLAAAINREMFELVYQACPSALSNAANDDITPLSIAALKNDKELFFKLLDLGLEISKSNEYTQIMMRQSIIPEITNLAEKHLDVEDYWNDTSDNIPVEKISDQISVDTLQSIGHNDNSNDSSTNVRVKPTFVFDHIDETNAPVKFRRNSKPYNLNLLSEFLKPVEQSLISPNLTCALDKVLPKSPDIYFPQGNRKNNTDNYTKPNKYTSGSSLALQRLQSVRPANLIIVTNEDVADLESSQNDANISLGYTPEFSPTRSPHVPPDINDENVYGENTPTPPRYKTPPRGMILNSKETKMFVLLKRLGLSQHAPIFLEQEVDLDLFVTLTEKDLIEIGIQRLSDRKDILTAISNVRHYYTTI